jgi:hypothetical protein
MTKDLLTKEMIKFLNLEYANAKEFMLDRPEFVHQAMSRCMGAVLYAQACGVPYEKCVYHYEQIKDKFEKLLVDRLKI